VLDTICNEMTHKNLSADAVRNDVRRIEQCIMFIERRETIKVECAKEQPFGSFFHFCLLCVGLSLKAEEIGVG